jgi:hypothetical protein
MAMPPRCAEARTRTRTLVLHSVLGFTVALTPACKDPDAPLEVYRAFAQGANVIPPPTSPADSSVRASVSVVLNSARVIGYAYSVFAAPSGTIDLIAFYEAAAGDTLPAIATAVLCDGAEACAATGGYATVVPPATAATIRASLRANGTQVVFFTTTAQKAAGRRDTRDDVPGSIALSLLMRGTVYPSPWRGDLG